MVATVPIHIGLQVKALRTAPNSRAAQPGWIGEVVRVRTMRDESEVVDVRFDRGPEVSPCRQTYYRDEWTTENVEILDGAQ